MQARHDSSRKDTFCWLRPSRHIALLLGVLPYLVLRGLVTRIALRWMGRASAGRPR